MTAMNATKARANLFTLMAFVNDNSQPLSFTNSKGKNTPLDKCLSEDEHSGMVAGEITGEDLFSL